MRTFESYCKDNQLMSLAVDRAYDDLFIILSKNNKVLKNDLAILFHYITGKKLNHLIILKL
ncbi:hypothetical protein KHA80_06305 [Anaerobacillus sp. HL2]|nr:hypothetical protein KHA80_06305 [Anaerobacillus sp. HL2]